MIAAVRCFFQEAARRTESGLQARPLFFNDLQTVLAELCHNCDMAFRFLFAKTSIRARSMFRSFGGVLRSARRRDRLVPH